MEWLLILLFVNLVWSLRDTVPTTKVSFTLSVEYSCRDWNPSFPNICQSPKYNITQPLKLSMEGMGDTYVPCNYVLGKGYGKGQHLSTFIYHVISRISSVTNNRLLSTDDSEDNNDVSGELDVDGLFDYIPLDSKPAFRPDLNNNSKRYRERRRFARQSSFKWSDLTSDERVTACGTRYDLGQTYKGFRSCPSECVYCVAPENRYGQLLRWHEGNGVCLRPQLIFNAQFWCIPGLSCPHWFNRFSYVYLTNSQDSDNPCLTPAVSRSDGDVTRLTCVPHS